MIIQVLDKEVSIKLPDEDIAISVSGGCDSALLLYLVYKEKIETNSDFSITAVTIPNPADNAEKHAKDIVSYVSNLLNVNIPHEILEYTSSNAARTIKEPIIKLRESGRFRFIFGAQNQFPDELKFDKRFIDDQGLNDRRDPIPNMNYPFLHLYKNHIMNMYKQFGLLDMLNITHSCVYESDFHCGECLWCVEKQWGLDNS